VHHRIHFVPADRLAQQRHIADVAHDEWRTERRLAVPRRQIVEDDDPAAGSGDKLGGVAADVAGAAGDQNGAQRYLPMEKYVKPCIRICSLL
jgi:hypothetical protein